MTKLLVTLIRSTNSARKNQIANVEALGLRKIGDAALHENNPAVQGMIHKVSHLLKVEEVEVEEAAE